MKHASYIVPEPTPVTAHGIACSAKIKEILSTPVPTGNYWAKQILAKVAAGERVTPTAYEMAKSAIGFEPEVEPVEEY